MPPRSDPTDPSRLLAETGDMNIGRAEIVRPAATAFGVAGNAAEVRILNVQSPDQKSTIATIAMSMNWVNQANPIGTIPPMVGIVEYGAGGAFHRLEFDIPPNFIAGDNGNSNLNLAGGAPVLPTRPFSNGVFVSLPGSTFRVYARNELKAPMGRSNLPIAPIDTRGSGSFENFAVSASISFLPAGLNSHLQRTFILNSSNAPFLAIGQTVSVRIPQWAHRVRFPREDLLTGGLDVTFAESGGNTFPGTYRIPAGAEGEISISHKYTTMNVTPTAGTAGLVDLSAVFDVGP